MLHYDEKKKGINSNG